MLTFLALVTTLIGHVGIWVAAYNQMNAMKLPRPMKKGIELMMICATLVLGLVFVAVRYPIGPISALSVDGVNASALGGYAIVCWMFAGFVCCRGMTWAVTLRRPANYTRDECQRINISQELGRIPTSDFSTKLFASLPANQLFELDVTNKEFQVDELPRALDGLRISHLSDIHMTGDIDREYYEEVVKQSNKLQPDIVVISGDIIDKAKCLSWIEPVFSKLNSKYGVFYVLGNHDLRIKDEKGLRKRLKQAGAVALNAKWTQVKVGNGKLWLTGNELPWFKGADKLGPLPKEYDSATDTSILVSHSPDQFAWACRRKFKLVLAGHTHGGQIRLPIIGPIVAPSRYGVKYASGVFKSGKTLMHVSRGVSGVHPVRFNCAPEISLLTLRTDRQAKQRRTEQETSNDASATSLQENKVNKESAPASVGSTGAA